MKHFLLAVLLVTSTATFAGDYERYLDERGLYVGRQDADGRNYDKEGRYIGREDKDGRYYDAEGRYRGRVIRDKNR